MRRPKLLDLYSCAGGGAMGYHRAGFDVTCVDIAPQPNNPFRFIQSDALEFLREFGNEFHAVHASPPCQSYLNLGAVNKAMGRSYLYEDLIPATRAALKRLGKPWVIENVEGAPLREPVRICGTGLDLPLRRHRNFESSFELIGVPCDHKRFSVAKYWTGWRPNGEHRLSTVVQVYGNAGGQREWPAAMGIDWMTPKEMTEAIPPAYTQHVGSQLMNELRVAA